MIRFTTYIYAYIHIYICIYGIYIYLKILYIYVTGQLIHFATELGKYGSLTTCDSLDPNGLRHSTSLQLWHFVGHKIDELVLLQLSEIGSTT